VKISRFTLASTTQPGSTNPIDAQSVLETLFAYKSTPQICNLGAENKMKDDSGEKIHYMDKVCFATSSSASVQIFRFPREVASQSFALSSGLMSNTTTRGSFTLADGGPEV
jgi:hypothetical protein